MEFIDFIPSAAAFIATAVLVIRCRLKLNISEIDILADGGIIITERPLGKPIAEEFPGLTRSKDYHYGKTTITLLRKTGAGGGND